MRSPSKAKIKQIEKILKDDILWTVKYGPGWDPYLGAEKNGRWHGNTGLNGVECGVCALGAYCVRRQPRGGVDANDNPRVFARQVGVPLEWAERLFGAVAYPNDSPARPVRPLAKRLREYGDKLSERETRERLRHEAAQEDQMEAEARGLA